MSCSGWGQLIAATCWASSDSSSPVWSASSKSLGSFVIQPHVTTIPFLHLFFYRLQRTTVLSLSRLPTSFFFRNNAELPRDLCVITAQASFLRVGFRLLNSDANACWMDMVNGGSWSLSLPEWWVVLHMATIWYGNPFLRLWMTRCGLCGSDGFHQFFWVPWRRELQSPCWFLTGRLSGNIESGFPKYPPSCFPCI